MREIQARASANDASAQLALRSFCYRIQKYIGAYMAVLGRVDALVFSGGIGEHSAWVREMVCDPLGHLNIAIDKELNQNVQDDTAPIQKENHIPVLVVSANEELDIARQVNNVLKSILQ
jgi:acetate kinase